MAPSARDRDANATATISARTGRVCVGLYLVILSTIFLRRFLRGAWKEMRIIGPAHASDPAPIEPEVENFAVVGEPGYPIAPSDANTRG